MRLYLGKGTVVRKYVLLLGLFTLLGSPSTQAGSSFTGLGDLAGGSFNSRAYGVSADGSAVVGRGSSASGTEAFVWDETNGMRGLMQVLMDQGIDMTGWSLTEARGVSADGLTIVGYGTNPLGQEEGWIATIVPEPSTALLLGLGLSALAATRRR